MTSMLAVRKAAPTRGVELTRDLPRPEPAADELLIKVRRSGICGSDKHLYLWDEWAAGNYPTAVHPGPRAGWGSSGHGSAGAGHFGGRHRGHREPYLLRRLPPLPHWKCARVREPAHSRHRRVRRICRIRRRAEPARVARAADDSAGAGGPLRAAGQRRARHHALRRFRPARRGVWLRSDGPDGHCGGLHGRSLSHRRHRRLGLSSYVGGASRGACDGRCRQLHRRTGHRGRPGRAPHRQPGDVGASHRAAAGPARIGQCGENCVPGYSAEADHHRPGRGVHVQGPGGLRRHRAA